MYHLPFWALAVVQPASAFTKSGRESLRRRAKERAEGLRRKAYNDRKRIDPGNISSSQRNSGIHELLRESADSIERTDFDVSIYVARLEDDWYNKVEQLRGLTVDTLSSYMPRMLAQTVYDTLSSDRVDSSERINCT